MKDIQKIQNKLVRFLNGKLLKDKISTCQLLKKLNMMSINQINAQIKLTVMWKACHTTNYPIEIRKQSTNDGATTTRAVANGRLVEPGTSNVATKTFVGDATRLWNKVPIEIKNSESLYTAKKLIKTYVKTLPI